MKTTNLFVIPMVAVIAVSSVHAITINTVPIGNPNNPNNPATINGELPTGTGSVAQAFRMGETEVSNSQYVAFLNAVADSDPFGLYNTNMGSDTRGGIVRSGADGSYIYTVKPAALAGLYPYGDKPVVWVSWGDAARFVNWLHNNQPTGAQGSGTTETGAYGLNGATTAAALTAVTRSSNAKWWIPSEAEWHKSAYYNPTTGSYFSYPTSSNIAPDNNLPIADTGNSANFAGNTGYTTGNASFPFTPVGAYTSSESPYGTFDQGGNAIEWYERAINATVRGFHGGGWDDGVDHLRSNQFYGTDATMELNDLGFRVATLSVPEPSSFALVSALALASCASIRRRRSHIAVRR